MKRIILLIIVTLLPCMMLAQASVKIDGAEKGLSYPDVEILIDEPQTFIPGARTEVILYALPNGTLIEWTVGKKVQPGDDWHFDIHHIAAQTAFLRAQDPKCNYITIFLKTKQKAWNNWHKQHLDIAKETYDRLFADVVELYKDYNPSLTISSHSGGGYLIFNYFRIADRINPAIKRLVFLDSVYGYTTEDHLDKFTEWLKDRSHYLSVISYEDSKVIFRGKPLVSQQGGTWGRSHQMVKDLGGRFRIKGEVKDVDDGSSLNPEAVKGSRKFSDETDESTNALMEIYRGLKGRISFKLLRSPEGLIWHLVLVEKNGFIDSALTGTRLEGCGYQFWGPRAYSEYIQ